MQDTPAEWMPIVELSRHRTWPSLGALRMRISALERAGVPVPFVRRLGRRVLISLPRWDAYIEAQAATSGSTHEAA